MHAFAAWKLGDNTAKDQGRLTLNPIPHLDMFGSLILPAILLFQQSEVMFGWAKPVPVNPGNFKNPQKDHMRVSFARWIMILVAFLKQLFYTSLVLGCFNLIPVPPLDGSWILSGLLPQGFSQFFEQIRRYGFIIFLLLMMSHALDYILSIPIGLAWGAFSLLASALGLG